MLYVDFETYYDNDYSLSKLTTEEYLRDPRFDVMLVAVAKDDEEPQWFSGSHALTHLWLMSFDWSSEAVCAHNAAFDMAILRSKFGIRPKLIVDTMLMARAYYGTRLSVSLKTLSQELLGGVKGSVVANMLGVHREQLTEEWKQHYAEYCMQDVRLCRDLYKHLSSSCPVEGGAVLQAFPTSELALIDWSVRASTEPMLQLDAGVLEGIIKDTTARRKMLEQQTGVGADALRKDETFAYLLRSLGVEPPTKTSPVTSAEVYAFSKQDVEFMDLLDYPDELVVSLVEARLESRSSIAQSRAERLLGIAKRGPLPFPLLYYGAVGTGRWSGDGKLNLQNLPRSSELRRAIKPPPGYKICVGDLSQIELRVNMYNARQTDVLGVLAIGGDVYAYAAGSIYGRTITKKDNPVERFVGKTAELLCGYGGGPEKFQQMLRIAARRDKIKLEDDSITMAQNVVYGYRSGHRGVVSLWNEGTRVIKLLASGGTGEFCGCRVSSGVIWLPNGIPMQYPNLVFDPSTNEWVYQKRLSRGMADARIYGGKLVENVTQALARIVMSDALTVLRSYYHVVGSVHDELILLVPETSDPEAIVQHVKSVMTQPCRFLPGIPLDAEVHVGDSYGDAK